MQTRNSVVVVIFSVLFGVLGCNDSSPPTKPESVLPGLPLGTTPQGHELTSGNFQGRVVLVCFWATWCGLSRSAVADLDSVWSDLAPSGRVALVAPALDTTEGALDNYLANHTHDFIITQGGTKESAAFQVRAVPTYFVLDTEGNLTWRAQGYPLPDSLEDAVNALISPQVAGR